MRSFIKNWVDKKGRKQGYWEIYWNNGKLREKGLYVNGLKEGIWEGYNEDGSRRCKMLFEDGYYIEFVR
jgi:antitoxin component YwqK of YwqJK toxin-antitoxin module